MKKLLITLMLSAMTPAAFAVTTIKAEVNGMVCAFCAKGIEKKLNALPQKQAAFVDLKSRVVALQLKDGQEVSDAAFSKVIEDAGYTVTKLARVNQTVEAIQAEVVKADHQAGSK
ncbi:heavy-metal-associated domain-containing protein [Methylophilus sp. 13]|uniref:heavy-metal-associated domain-containing protein n=1 Tax=Methylophilus sp. 13 TaxID=2781018 RepID=UPI00188EF1EE|nr:heavy-metal-associated domain-containing protein [Methylophilus sp. 13]MBF5038311.1 heavy-metal-associated domain-containing protein [Methylophilus sp. 13]